MQKRAVSVPIRRGYRFVVDSMEKNYSYIYPFGLLFWDLSIIPRQQTGPGGDAKSYKNLCHLLHPSFLFWDGKYPN